MDEGRLLWLAWERRPDGSYRVLETREARAGEEASHRRIPREFESLEQAAGRYGRRFRELVREVLESGSSRGRYRP